MLQFKSSELITVTEVTGRYKSEEELYNSLYQSCDLMIYDANTCTFEELDDWRMNIVVLKMWYDNNYMSIPVRYGVANIGDRMFFAISYQFDIEQQCKTWFLYDTAYFRGDIDEDSCYDMIADYYSYNFLPRHILHVEFHDGGYIEYYSDTDPDEYNFTEILDEHKSLDSTVFKMTVIKGKNDNYTRQFEQLGLI